MNSTTLFAFQDELQKIAGAPLISVTEPTPGFNYPTTRFVPDPNWSPPSASPASSGLSTRGKVGLGLALATPVALAGLHAMRKRKKRAAQQT
jgi:hypothetical protein